MTPGATPLRWAAWEEWSACPCSGMHAAGMQMRPRLDSPAVTWFYGFTSWVNFWWHSNSDFFLRLIKLAMSLFSCQIEDMTDCD